MFVSPGEPRAICPNPTIEAVEGDAVTLPCYLDPPHSVVDYAADWKRADLKKVVYSYRHKQENRNDQMAQYKGRTTFNFDNLIRGNMALQISSLQPSDSGPYECFVSRLWTSCGVNVTVVSKDQQNTTERDDYSAPRPPLDEPHNTDGRNRETARAVIISTVVLLFGVLIVVLVKRGTIQKSMTRLRGQGEQKSEAANGCELKHLRTSSTNSDPDAGNLNNVQVVK
ncbi:butyrophilin subfamily 3 member A2-like [Micropterus salmoides]|uniref:butyrophilin subfamily 3 member A2-like n=1 Tax=Micropterus salmoides TaxID=27706 RepID=UPI0018EC5F7E|nr:butyrophilin subfamily 3 member A2-like [Micropterus salmoides]